MKKPNNRILLSLAITSLLIIFSVVTIGTLKGRYTFFLKKNKESIVLGITDKLPFKNLSSEGIENTLEDITTQTRGLISKKAVEAERQLKNSLEKELTELTSNQIRSIQTKICQDWGVISSNSASKE